MDKIEVEILDKHRNYLRYYQANDIFWGIGIENETYLEMSKQLDICDNSFYINNAKRERYSVNYYTSYKKNVYNDMLKKIELKTKIPILVNAHTFTKTDINNEHKTLYKTNSPDNPKFNGETIFDLICRIDKYFSDEYMKSYIFDGDTIEFVSQNFYKVTIYDTINELKTVKNTFINRLKKVFTENKIFEKYGEISLCNTNYPFVSFMTNINNYSIFNNMTYHFNFTLPTKLNKNGYIENYKDFISQHKNAIKLIQWIEPILIAIYGTGDIFSSSNSKLTNSSQRCAKSRYIGIGTYDTDTMIPGKLLQLDSENNHLSKLDYWWFNQYYNISDYTKEPKIGFDINFHKHKNHGIELRIFDYFEESKLEEVMKFIVLILDYSLDNEIENCVINKDWNDLMFNIILNKNYILSEKIKTTYKTIFNLSTDSFNNCNELFNIIFNELLNRYQNNGICYTNMVESPVINRELKIDSCSPENNENKLSIEKENNNKCCVLC